MILILIESKAIKPLVLIFHKIYCAKSTEFGYKSVKPQ